MLPPTQRRLLATNGAVKTVHMNTAPAAITAREFCARGGVLLIHAAKVTFIIDVVRGSVIEVARVGGARGERDTKGGRALANVNSNELKERLRSMLVAVDDLRSLQADERRRHESTWEAPEESCRGLERFASEIQSRVRAIVEGRA